MYQENKITLSIRKARREYRVRISAISEVGDEEIGDSNHQRTLPYDLKGYISKEGMIRMTMQN